MTKFSNSASGIVNATLFWKRISQNNLIYEYSYNNQ